MCIRDSFCIVAFCMNTSPPPPFALPHCSSVSIASLPFLINSVFLCSLYCSACSIPVHTAYFSSATKVAKGAKPKYAGMTDCAKQLYSTGGLRSIFKGSEATLMRDVPG